MPPRPLADLIDACLAPVLAQQGFAGRQVVSLWTDIVGERLAARSRPLKIDWPRRRQGIGLAAREKTDSPPDPATLVVRVEGAFALELQHLAPVVIERVNRHLGWRAVGRIVLKQGPVPAVAPTTDAAPPGRDVIERVERATVKVSDENLRQSLIRLGTQIARRMDK